MTVARRWQGADRGVLAAFELCVGLGDVVLARLLGEGARLRLDARH